MPKERLHILLAEETRQYLHSKGASLLDAPEMRLSFLLGAISPDTLFYDVPFFKLNSTGNAIHRLENDLELSFFLRWIDEEVKGGPLSMLAWSLGLISHFLVDALWHPRINHFVVPPFLPCRNLQLTARECHHWLESEIEAFWINRRGPHDGYRPLLKELGRKACLRGDYATFVRNFLEKMEVKPIPEIRRIKWSYFWQTQLLQCFAHKTWGQAKPFLQSRKVTRPYGVLIVPLLPSLPKVSEAAHRENDTAQNFFNPALMEETVTELANRLLSLPVWTL